MEGRGRGGRASAEPVLALSSHMTSESSFGEINQVEPTVGP